MANGRPIWKRRRHRLATKPVPPRPVPRLYLATPEVDDPSSLAAGLPGLLAAADVAAVFLRLKPTAQRRKISRVQAPAPAVQGKGATPNPERKRPNPRHAKSSLAAFCFTKKTNTNEYWTD